MVMNKFQAPDKLLFLAPSIKYFLAEIIRTKGSINSRQAGYIATPAG